METLRLVMDVPRALSPAEFTGTWIVAQVLSHHENRVARDVCVEEFRFYLPTYSIVRRYESGRKTRILPLFPGYLFVNYYHDSELYALRSHASCYGLIEVKNQTKFASELAKVHSFNESGELRPYNHPVVGQKCRFVDGPFLNQVGTVVHADNKKCLFVIQTTIMGQAIGIEVPPEQLEVLEDAA